jgi:hemerythrin-like metal-binding protein
MPLIIWDDEFALGISEIDEQHKKILEIINRLYDLFENHKQGNQTEIDHIIRELADYANYHFQTEEKYFQLFNYEKAAEHIAIHNQYRAKTEEWRKRYEDDKDKPEQSKALFFEVSNFLQDWWTWHIKNTDRAYLPFLKANGVK